MSGETLIQARGLNAFYGRAQALFGVSLEVRRGEVVALLGRNGAGKSTTLKALMGLVPPRAGEVRIAGTAVRGWAPYRICRQGLGYVPEERRIFAGLTVLENLEVGRRPPREAVPAWTPQRLFELFPNLGRMRERPGGAMSGGEQQMLTMCRTLMGDPDLVLIDEPTEGLAPKLVEQVGVLLDEIARRGVAILLVEQKLTIALKISTRLYVMGHGHIVFEGDPASLAANENVRKEWLEV